MNGPTTAQLEDIFLGPAGPVDISPASTDWLLPTYQQPYYASQFPEGTFEGYLPEPAPRVGAWDWLTPIAQPFQNFTESLYKAAGPAITQTYEKLPELLWEKYVVKPKQRVVNEGAGVVVTHSQPPHAGGEPAKPITANIPQMLPAWMPQARAKDNVLWIGAGMLILYLLFRSKGK